MPGHTPEEQAKNSADTSTQPGFDRDGGAAAVPNDSGFQARFQQWEQFLARPEVRAGLLQFSVQILQPNPGGFGAALGQSVGAGLGAAGRVATLEREQGEATAALEVEAGEREADASQQRRENERAERGLVLDEALNPARIGAFERSNRGSGATGAKASAKAEAAALEKWVDHWTANLPFGTDPGTITRFADMSRFLEKTGLLERAQAADPELTVLQIVEQALRKQTAGPVGDPSAPGGDEVPGESTVGGETGSLGADITGTGIPERLDIEAQTRGFKEASRTRPERLKVAREAARVEITAKLGPRLSNPTDLETTQAEFDRIQKAQIVWDDAFNALVKQKMKEDALGG